MSPHLQIWRWHITMTASILFRVTIGAATVGAAMLVGWLAVLASGPDAYAQFLSCAASPLGLLVGIGLTWVLFSFLLNGGRHLINDTGAGLTVPSANLLSHIAVWGPFVLTAIFWIVLFASGKVSL
ncbi:MAG: succinate dehydrogenase, cytochrome b556 subunit [Brevundimonas sp.]|nr:MAG: succinate dehydrogenase, cytochrome b556 subunit [Brevundimonas sp.]